MELEAVKLLAGAIALLPLIGVGIGLGTKFFLTFALTEALAIFALLIAFYLVFAA